MLHLVELELPHRALYRIGVTPFADMGLEPEPICLREAIERLEVLDGCANSSPEILTVR